MRFLRFESPACAAILAFTGVFVVSSAAETSTLVAAFESTTVQIQVMPDAQNVPVEWKFNNQGKEPLLVEKFEESCGCLSGKLDQKVFQTGEGGVIQASFTPGPNRGLVRKSIHVRFVGHEKPVELIVEAKVASSVQLSTQEVVWAPDASVKSQQVEVTTGTGVDFEITSLQGIAESQFTISRETITPKRHYRLTITAVSVESPGVHCLQVHTDSQDTRDQVLPLFLRIAPATAENQTR